MTKDNFDQSVSFPMDEEYFEQSVEEIKEQQKVRDASCMQLIEQAATTGVLMLNDKVIDKNSPEASHPEAHLFKIDDDARKLLESYYHDGMEVYRQMYLVFDSIFGEEEYLCIRYSFYRIRNSSGRCIYRKQNFLQQRIARIGLGS